MTAGTRPNNNTELKAGGILKRVFVRPETAIFAGYAAITCFVTYPAVTLLSQTYAEKRDPLGTLWVLWWFKYAFAHRLPVSPMRLVAVPEGLRLDVYKVDPLFNLLSRTLSIVTTETVAYNLILLLSYFFAAVAMYFLVRHITGSRAGATFSGLAFGFSPYMLAQGKEHLSLVVTLWLPLFALLLVIAWRSRSTWSIVTCGLVFLVMTLFSYQYGMIAAVFGFTFLVTVWLSGRPWRRRAFNKKRALVVAGVIVVISAVAAASLVFLGRSAFSADKPLVSLYQYSARPWDYFIPTAESVAFGGFTRGFITSHLHGGFLVENSLFLGYTTMALAAYAVVVASLRWRKRRKSITEQVDVGKESQSASATTGFDDTIEGPDDGRLMLAFSACAVVAFIFSMPPTTTVLGVKLHFPSYIVFKILPQFRAYARFGIIVMMCTAVLAGYGIAYLAKWLGGGKRIVPVAALLMTLILVEFTIVPPFYTLDTRTTTDYFEWLALQPGRPVAAVYPLYSLDDFYNYGYLFAQRIHKKPLVNGAGPDGRAERNREVMLDIKHPATPGLLKKAGARYVIVIPGYYAEPVIHPNYPFPTFMEVDGMPTGLKKIETFRDATVYEVTAPPTPFVPTFYRGAVEPYVGPDGRSWHPGGKKVVVNIRSDLKEPMACTIKLKIMSVRSNSRVTFAVNGERKVEVEVPVWPVDLEIGDVVLSPGTNTMSVETTGSEARLTEVPGYSDIQASMLLGDILVERKQ